MKARATRVRKPTVRGARNQPSGARSGVKPCAQPGAQSGVKPGAQPGVESGEVRFHTLAAVERAVIGCNLCPRLRAHCLHIAFIKKRAFRDQEYWAKPVPGFGDPEARLLVIGLAPAAHGGNRTGRLFTGDSSGSWLYEALHLTGFANQPGSTGRGDGLRLSDCYVSAAGRCAPPQNKPTSGELNNCGPFLEAETRLLIRVRVVMTLGRIAWERWLKVSGWWEKLAVKERPRFGHGTEGVLPDGTILLCSFHPSRQNTQTGRLTRSMWETVFSRARVLVDGARP